MMTSTTASAMSIAVRAVDLPGSNASCRTTGSCSSVSALRRGGRGGRGSGAAWDPRRPGHDERRLELGAPRVCLCELVAHVVERALRVGHLCLEALELGRGRSAAARASAAAGASWRSAANPLERWCRAAPRVAQFPAQRVHGAREADLEPGVADPVRDRQLQQGPAPGRQRVGRRGVRRQLERRGERGAQHAVLGAVGLDDRTQLEALDRVLQQQLDARAERPGPAGRPSSSMMATSLPAGATWKRMTSKVGSTLRRRGAARPRHDRRPGVPRRRASPCARPRRRPRSSRRHGGGRRRGRADGRPGLGTRAPSPRCGAADSQPPTRMSTAPPSATQPPDARSAPSVPGGPEQGDARPR